MSEIITIKSCLDANKKALTYGNRLILPFHCRLVSITVGLEMSTIASPDVYCDFSPSEREVMIVEEDKYTNIYFSDYKDLNSEFGKHKGGVIITCCEKSDDLFDTKMYKRLKMRFRDDSPVVTIELV